MSKSVPNLTVATDIICGFPYETKEDFDQTLHLVDKYRFHVLNISQFYPRPGTVAMKWKRVDTREVKNRSTALTKLFNSYPNYTNLLGTIQRIWIHENTNDSKKEGEPLMVGHNKSYVKILVKRDESLIGHQIIVKVTEIHKWHVYGEIVDRNPKCISVNFYDHFKGIYQEPNKESKEIGSKFKEQVNIHDMIDVFEVKSKKVENFVISETDNATNLESTKQGIGKINTTTNLTTVNIIVAMLYLLAIVFMTLGLKDINVNSYFKTATVE